MSRRLLFALPLLLAGCLSDGVADSTVCVAGAVVDDVETTQLHADEPLQIESFLYPDCGESIEDHTCSATVVGDQIVVTVDARVRQTPKFACKEMLIAIPALCSTPPLPAGTYTLVHEGDSQEFTVPSDEPLPCVQATVR